MKISFKQKEKEREATVEADVESLVSKALDYNPDRKTRYQIKQEEKRKNIELKHKQEMQKLYIGIGVVAFCILLCIICSVCGM